MRRFNNKLFGVPGRTRSGRLGFRFGVPKAILGIGLGCILAATTAQAGWARTYGTEANERGFCVQITSDGNYIITGYTSDGGSAELLLLKVDTSGIILWFNNYGRGNGKWVEETSDGDYIVAARMPSLVKVNAQGDTLWTRDFGMYSYCVQETSDSGYIVVGGDNGNEADSYLVLIKTNSNGDTIWTKTYTEPEHDFNSGLFIQQTPDSGYIITGSTTYAEGEDFATGYLWLVKTDANGNTVWTQNYGTGDAFEFNKGCCVRQTTDGGYIITGLRDFAPRGIWLLKTDEEGDTLWTKTYSAPSGGTGFSVQETEDGGYIIVGVTETFTANLALNPGTAKLWLLKTDAYGDTLWTRMYSGDGYDVGRCVQQIENLGYIIVGYTSSRGAGGSDVYLLKTDSLGLLGVAEESVTDNSKNWQVVSSIGSQIVLHYFGRPHGFRACIFNACGQKVEEVYEREPVGSVTWGSGHSSGVYFLQVVEDKNKTKTERIVIIR